MENNKIEIVDKSGDKEHFLLHYFEKDELILFKNWIKENYSCIACMDRCLEKGWAQEEIEKIYKIINKIV